MLARNCQWAINIAISLIRLGLLSYGRPTGPFPRLGTLEAHPIEARTNNDLGYLLMGENFHIGGSTLHGWYEVGKAEADHFKSMKLSEIADMVFDAQQDTVAERLYNGLGWMTLAPQESPHFENGLISALFGPHVQRMGSPKAPHLSWRDLSLDDCETRTRTSGLVIRDSPHQNANLQLHFGPRKNEGMAERLPAKLRRAPSVLSTTLLRLRLCLQAATRLHP